MPVKRFVTKRVEIDAIQFDGENFEELDFWTDGRFIEAPTADGEFQAQVYDVLHATWIAVKTGQWIVRGAKGEFYPCDDETFHWKYEEVIETHEPDGTVAQFPARAEGLHPVSSERVERLSRRVQADPVWNDEEIPPGPPVPPPPPPGMEWA